MVMRYLLSVRSTESLIQQLKVANEDLKRIQLMKIEPTSTIEYLKQLIISEKAQKNPGYLDRVN